MEEEIRISSNMIRGHTDTIVLARLLKKDCYGFEIYSKILELTKENVEIKETTLYSSYKRLEKSGYISSYWGDETMGARRKYYHITEAGKKLYTQNKEQYESEKKIIESLLKEDK